MTSDDYTEYNSKTFKSAIGNSCLIVSHNRASNVSDQDRQVYIEVHGGNLSYTVLSSEKARELRDHLNLLLGESGEAVPDTDRLVNAMNRLSDALENFNK